METRTRKFGRWLHEGGYAAEVEIEVLNESLFLDLGQAGQIIAVWVADYNTRRPHSSLGYKTPAAYADYLTATGHRAALRDGSARCPVAHTAPKGVSKAEALIATG